jgi:hypothetical protein
LGACAWLARQCLVSKPELNAPLRALFTHVAIRRSRGHWRRAPRLVPHQPGIT